MHPESQHVPLCQHLLGFAMKSVTQTAMGNRFENDQEVICFQKGHDLVSVPGWNAEQHSVVLGKYNIFNIASDHCLKKIETKWDHSGRRNSSLIAIDLNRQ